MSEGISIGFGSSRQPLTAAAARMAGFDTVRRHGLDPDQVADFVDHVCETISHLSRARDEANAYVSELNDAVAILREEVATITRQRDTASERSAALTQEVAELRERLAKSPGEAAAEVLMLAHEAAASTAERAAEAAAATAERIIADADAEADRRRLLVTTELAGRVARVEYLTRVETELCSQLSTVADTVRAQLETLPGLGLDALTVVDAVQASLARSERGQSALADSPSPDEEAGDALCEVDVLGESVTFSQPESADSGSVSLAEELVDLSIPVQESTGSRQLCAQEGEFDPAASSVSSQ